MRKSLLTTTVCSLAVAGMLSLSPALGAEHQGSRSVQLQQTKDSVRQTAPPSSGRDQLKPAPDPTSRIGLAHQELTPDLAEALDLPQGVEGILVRSVQEGGPAFRVGMKPGMVIVTIDGKRAKTPEDLAAAVKKKPAGRPIMLGVMAG
ncbi:MAG TPA: PDZ domain-containing protein, partial [Azospirillum sp.]|nr:PDZ domain-containing protein [Azospirillum sp.]